MGGQLIQRYSIVGGGPSARTGLSVTYVIANPSTYLWLDSQRPAKQCPEQNKYKYGLDGMREALAIYEPAQHEVAELWTRYAGRTVHYLHGDNDNGKGDGRPAAMAQGERPRLKSQFVLDSLSPHHRQEPQAPRAQLARLYRHARHTSNTYAGLGARGGA